MKNKIEISFDGEKTRHQVVNYRSERFVVAKEIGCILNQCERKLRARKRGCVWMRTTVSGERRDGKKEKKKKNTRSLARQKKMEENKI